MNVCPDPRRQSALRRLAPPPSLPRPWAAALLLLALCSASLARTVEGADGSAVPDTAPATGQAQSESEFFAWNAGQPGVVSLPGGAQARRLSAGDGPSAAGAELVVLNISRRRLHDAAGSDTGATLRQQRYQTRNLPPAIYQALQGMQVGDRWEVFAPAQGKGHRHGAHGAQGPMPATVFTIELLSAR